MSKKLVIVESPTKAKTISRFLGNEYLVESSFGHIRDLPEKKMGINIENDFEPHYEIPDKAASIVARLRKIAKSVDRVYLATDADREGEAIAWHLTEALGIDLDQTERIVFHEITETAIQNAIQNPRHINLDLVDAQQARRVLDRLVGYELSPFLWKKVAKGLSAGRVQSVALRLIVEREDQIKKFEPQEYWTVTADFKCKDNEDVKLTAELHAKEGKKLKKFDIPHQELAGEMVTRLRASEYYVLKITKKQQTRNPAPPYITSSMQQDANRKLGFSAKQTMFIAQKMYEGINVGSDGEQGLITYMRTDSLNLSPSFLSDVRQYIASEVGPDYCPNKPKVFKSKSKGAQEAHEAIRPTSVARTPQSIKKYLDDKTFKLYKLIWERAVASQMQPAIVERTTIDINTSDDYYTLRASGGIIKFDGFLRVVSDQLEETILPQLEEDASMLLEKVTPKQHFTEPPSRYSDASIVKELEEYGIGRPSTYAPTISTIIDRGYVERLGQSRLNPTDIGVLVNDVLTKHFTNIIDYEFTARLETDFDTISEGKHNWQSAVKKFYEPFKENLENKSETVKREDLIKKREIGIDPESGLPIIARIGRFGAYVQLGEWSEEGKEANDGKPKMSSLEKGQSIDTLSLEEALQLLVLPRMVGKNADDEEIIANIGRYGPYLKVGGKTVSLPENYSPQTISLVECKAVIEQADKISEEKAKPISDLGEDPTTKGQILVKNGRYGPYITDGKTNVSVPKNMEPNDITRESAIDLLDKKRNSPSRSRKKSK
ncbi:TPA: type I DNA topoisomerase [Candidatus Poribacteria bacterium]|nr:type I DNA topoisomerase [Candidatus Poribacteria bacterium]HIB86379.1 type I DNA topoisomerase [Candidatus Poribacteria bacterium]HIN29527.1 type I DNA topoisomerase [Candidatus Poribacteria bacterium]HIO49613.1 type I DNA topoisomerase [Candidatus Poribacteria bacterium]